MGERFHSFLSAAVFGVLIGFSGNAGAAAHTNLQTVFLIVMENVSWSQIAGSPAAPYINQTLLPMASYCQRYYSPTGVASSLPDYFWLEGGTNYGITASPEPATARITSTNHLVTQLYNSGISWKSYQENISGTSCPTNSSGLYAAYHNPFVYFNDATTDSAYCLANIRPYGELDADLRSNTVARYNFITPNLCNDMHNANDARCASSNRITTGDLWLSTEIPRIMNSPAYSNNGAIFITWDESELPPTQTPIGMIVLSPLAKGGGYFNTNYYNHASTLRTMQEIFGVRPFLFGANTVSSLGDLFQPTISLSSVAISASGVLEFRATGDFKGATNLIQASTTLTDWVTISTNAVSTNTFVFTDSGTANYGQRFYRVRQVW
jgi:hypothetical protein